MIQQSHSWVYIQKRRKLLIQKDMCTPVLYKMISGFWKLPLWLSNSTLRISPMWNGKTCSHTDLYKKVHSSIIHNNQMVETTQMTISWWVNKMWYIHSIEHYLAIKKNQVEYLMQHRWISKALFPVKKANH